MPRFVILCLLLSLSACGAGRTFVPLPMPTPAAARAEALAIKLVVTDARTFEERPRLASTPSLAAEDFADADLRARAIGRKRSDMGKARGDFMLPDGQSVAALVRAHVADAIAKAGGVVVAETDPRFESAKALEVNVKRFWSWMRPGAFKEQVEFDVELALRGALPGFETDVIVNVHRTVRRANVNEVRWRGLLEAGLVELDASLSKALTPALKP